jgi:2'-5' RNA ligase
LSARLFVALELPEEVRAALAAWRPRDEALRPVAPEALHVTLAFLGARDEEEAPAIGALLAPLARPVRALALGGAVWLPPRRPGVLAARVEDRDGALAALQADVAGVLARAGVFAPERRPFLAHVTVARVRRGAAVPRDDRAAAGPPAMGFAAPSVTLLRSHLSPRGARYEALTRVALA